MSKESDSLLQQQEIVKLRAEVQFLRNALQCSNGQLELMLDQAKSAQLSMRAFALKDTVGGRHG